jgi:hypothetical protein
LIEGVLALGDSLGLLTVAEGGPGQGAARRRRRRFVTAGACRGAGGWLQRRRAHAVSARRSG